MDTPRLPSDPTLQQDGSSRASQPRAVHGHPSHIVGLGASAGGLEALQSFFGSMPDDSGMAFVIIQHLSPHFKSMMDELLGRHTQMTIVVVTESVTIQANHVYLLPPGFDMVLDGETLSVRGKAPGAQLQTPISDFFVELGRQIGDRSVGIVLSGTGSDGSHGLRSIWECGGLVLAQDQDSAKFESMPNHAIATGLAHAVLPPRELPAELLRLTRYRLEQEKVPGTASGSDQDKTPFQLQHQILSRLDRAFDLNFAQYKSDTIRRRIERRVAVVNAESLEEYAKKVENDNDELRALYDDLLIGVTQFMRDPEAFKVLEERVIPKIIEQRGTRDEVRVWVAGCATGEEAYSIAILFLEAIEKAHLNIKLRVFATDRHRDSLRIGGEGVYSDEQLIAFSPAMRAKYFSSEGMNRNRVIARLRKCLIFSSHNLLKDPPFTNVDLISCRNVLIYFRPQAQRRVLGVLYFALRPHGFMFLGSSESNKDFEREFRAISSRWKMYEKVTSYRLSSNFEPPQLSKGEQELHPSRVAPRDPWLGRAYNELLRRYIPTGALITDQRKVLHLFGDAQNYLRPPEGRMTQDIVDMATGNLKLAMSSVIQRVVRSEDAIDLRSVEVQDVKGNARIVDVRAEPVHDKVSKITLYLVILLNERNAQEPSLSTIEFQRNPSTVTPGEVRHFDSSGDAHERIEMLETELSHARQSLQSAVEELETSNEELQSSNEELLASNEELQSTNEELHSVNEELYSVNAEHEEKIHELHKVTGDLRNLMQVTDVGLVFTDTDLRIRLFTPKASEILNILPQDVGREIYHLTSKVRMDEINADIQKASKQNCPVDARVALDDGRVFLRRITPYVDMDQQPAGLLVTFVDITALQLAQARQAETELRMRLATQASGVGIWEWHQASQTIRWDERMYQLYGLDPRGSPSITPASWQACVNPQDWQRLSSALENPEASHGTFEISIYRGTERQERIIRVDLTSRPASPGQEGSWLVGTHYEVTEERQAQARLQEDEARYRSIMEHSPHGIASLDAQGQITQVNSQFARIFGANQDSFNGQRITRYFVPPPASGLSTTQSSPASAQTTVGYRCDGSRFPLDLLRSEIKVRGQAVTLLFVNDLTEQQQSARRQQMLAAIVENTDDAIFSTALDGTVRTWNPGAERIYGFSSSEMLGKNLASLVPQAGDEEHRGLTQLVSQGSTVRNRELKRVRKDLSVLDVAVTMTPMRGEQGEIIGISCTERDISEQKRQAAERERIEAKMIESAKLESLGVLAGGIAHDFNNLLGGILGSASVVETLLEGQPSNEALQRNMQLIRDASTRAAELCHQLLAYSGRGRFLIESIDLSRLVRETSSLISSSISKQLDVVFDLSPDLPLVSMDATQIRQVVMNLVINASESMGTSPGKIEISTNLVELDGKEQNQKDATFRTELEPGKYVTLRVQDYGCGIEADTIERVFDPFFTTKFTGRGLGLSAVLGIARGHKGGLWVESALGQGTVFTLFLRAKETGVTYQPPEKAPETFEGEGEVLIVDDEPLLRESLSFMLDSMGFQVHHASDGIEALEILRATPDRFKMVFLDLTMPRLNGTEALREIRRLGNEVPVLLMSGYHRNEATAAVDDSQIAGFIAKPFDRQALVTVLHRAFQGQAALKA